MLQSRAEENWYYLGRKSEKIRFSSEEKTVVLVLLHLFEFSLSAIINKWNAKGQHLHLVFDHVTWLTMLGTKLWSICWHAMSIQFTLLAKQVAIAENVAENWSQVEPAAAMLPQRPIMRPVCHRDGLDLNSEVDFNHVLGATAAHFHFYLNKRYSLKREWKNFSSPFNSCAKEPFLFWFFSLLIL
jgi:hypothetical protein